MKNHFHLRCHPEFGMFWNRRMNEAVLGEDAGFVERNVALRFAELNLALQF
jgi:hypothetical protein